MSRIKYKINVIFFIYAVGLIASNVVLANNTLPAGAITQLQQGSSVYTVAFSPDGRVLASGGTDNSVILWDVNGRVQLNTFAKHGDWVKSVAFSPDGRILASSGLDGFVKLWDFSSDREAITFKHSDYVASVAFSPDGRMLVSSGSDGSIKLWDVSKTRNITTIMGHRGGVASVAFSPDGRMLASASYDGTLKVWSAGGSEIKSLTGHKGGSGVLSVAFSPDGRMLASGGKDNTIKLWAIPSGDVLATLEHDYVESVAFSPNGKTLASASADYTVKLWSTSSQTEIVSLKGHRNRVTSVAFSPSGKTLASGSRDGAILVWDLSQFDMESTLIANVSKTPDSLKVEKLQNPISTALSEFLRESDSPEVGGFEDPPINDSAAEPEPLVSENKDLPPRQDTTPPEVIVHSHIERIVDSTVRQIPIEVKVFDDSRVAEVQINDRQASILEESVFSATIPLDFGENEIRVTATDARGNMGTHQFIIHREKSDRIDPTPPNIVMHSPNAPIMYHAAEQFVVRGNVTDDKGVSEIKVNGLKTTISESGVFSKTVLLFEGENLIRVTAMDTSGNMDTTQFTIVRDEILRDTTGPDIRILYPAVHTTRGVKAKIHLTEAFTRVSGTVTDPSGIAEVKVRGVEAQVAGSKFTATIPLDYGDNPLSVTAIDTKGNRSVEGITVFRKKAAYERKGKDYALLFAVESYDHWPNLMSPLYDAQAIRMDLQSTYGFQVELIHNPTRAEIVGTLIKYAEKQYTDEDQLLIFFAGHGHFNKILKEGYLVAQNTSKPEDDITMESYLSHSEFRNIIDRMSCKHIFLVLDTCYSGTFDQRIAMRGEVEDVSKPLSHADIEQKLKYMTRWYLTSGGKEQVFDGGRGHSPFAHELLEALRSKGGRDNILTIDEVLRYLERLDNPKPRASGFGRNEPGSDFLFIVE